MREGEMEDDRGMVMEVQCVVCIQNLGERPVLILIIVGISICMVVVVVVVVVFFKERSLSVMVMECLGVGFWLVGGGIFNLGRDFVALVVEVDVEDLELVDGESCCEASPGLFEWEDVFLVTFESNACGRENIQCR